MTIAINYVALQDSNISANGTATALYSTDLGNNSGWGIFSGGVYVRFVNIQDSNVLPFRGWAAYLSEGNIDGGNNNGWVFNSPLKHRLTDQGVLQTNTYFDEYTFGSLGNNSQPKYKTDVILCNQLDEVTYYNNPAKMRVSNTGTIFVAGQFDEYTTLTY